MKYGNIRQYLSVTPAADRLNLMTDVAEGLKYLHNEALVVHGDIRPAKVLVSESGRALITGFAMSTDILASLRRHDPESSESVRMEQPAKPSTYCCPELFCPAPRRTTASDIYALGTMIFEILSGQEPISGVNTLQIMGPCSLSAGKAEALWQLSRVCRAWEPHKRPHAAAVLRELSDIERGTNPDNRPNDDLSQIPPSGLRPHLSPPTRSPLPYRPAPPSVPDPPVFPYAAMLDPPMWPLLNVMNPPVTPGTSTIISDHVGSPSVPAASAAFPPAVSRQPGVSDPSAVADNSGIEIDIPAPALERISSNRYPETLTFPYETASLSPRDVELCYRGPCSSVWRGSVSIAGQVQNVAIKILYAETSSPGAPGPRQAFDRELRIWQKLRHPNILPLFSSNPEACAFVSPFMQEGTLLNYLEKHEGRADSLSLICDVAEGIYYLHKIAGVVHGDVKPENIFVTDDGHAILGDFGLSTTISPGNDVTELNIRSQFTVAYCAPELMEDKAVYPSRPTTQRSKTTMTDMYAFGLVLYQVYGGFLPKAGPSGHLKFFLQMNDGVLPPKLEPNRRASLFCEEVWAHCVRCWSKDPLARPDIDALLGQLKDIRLRVIDRRPRRLTASPAPSLGRADGIFTGGLLSVPGSAAARPRDVPRVENEAGHGTPVPDSSHRLATAREVCTRWIRIAAYLSLIYFVGNYWITFLVY